MWKQIRCQMKRGLKQNRKELFWRKINPDRKLLGFLSGIVYKAVGGLNACRAEDTRHTDGFAALAAVFLGGLFVVAALLDVANQTFFFAHFLEALDHLLNRFAGTRLYFNHTFIDFPFIWYINYRNKEWDSLACAGYFSSINFGFGQVNHRI